MEEEGLVSEPERESMIGQEKLPSISELSIKIDKLEGQMELFKGILDSLNERLGEQNEKLGDTRRMVFEREKWASRIEADFNKVASIVKELDPEKIVMRFEKFKVDIDKMSGKVQKSEELLAALESRLKEVEDRLGKIRDLENIMKAAEGVDARLKEMEKTKNYVDKLASKMEAMFLETNELLGKVRKSATRIESTEELTNDLAKEIESLKFRIDEELVKKKDIDELINATKDIIVEEVTGINPAAFDNLRKRVAILENREKSRKELEDEVKKLSLLLDKIERDYQMGRISDEAYYEIKKSTEKKIEEINLVLEERASQKGGAKKQKGGEKPLKEKLIATVKGEKPAKVALKERLLKKSSKK